MKNKFKFLLFILCFFFIGNVKANTVDSINMDIYIDDNGTAHVTEVWNANLTEGTEGYKPYYNIGESSFENFTVSMDDNLFENLSYWNTSGTLQSKSYKNGINNISNGLELCFGISSYGKHKYTLKYDITNFVTRTTDSDMVYWTLMPEDFSASPDLVYIKIYSDFKYEDSLDVWAYGYYGGTAYVYDGYIEMETDEGLDSNQYMTVLIKFPLNSFTGLKNEVNNNFDYYYKQAEEGTTHYTSDDDNHFDYYYKQAEEGTTHYTSDDDNHFGIGEFIASFLPLLFWVIFVVSMVVKGGGTLKYGTKKLEFGAKGNKLPKYVNLFRELPCGKDLYRAYWIACNYDLVKKPTDFLGTILLKWLKQDKIVIGTNEVGTIFKKEATTITFRDSSCTLDNELESKLYSYMYKASKDGILEKKEFERWCNSNYSTILKWFNDVIDYESGILEKEGKLTSKVVTKLKIFKSTVYDVNPSMYDEAIKVKGLKEFFREFGNMKDKSAIEVKLWEEYLMYAQIFGVAEKVAKQFKEMYPDVITDYSYDSFIFIHGISYSGMSSATTAQSRANSYSSGGGGFSSGGGGGGSFGGGGGGGGFR